MKNIFKTLLNAITFLLLIIGVNSCSDDGHSLGDFVVDWATVTDDSGHSFKLDNGKTLWAAASATNYVPKNRRVIINYTVLSDNFEEYDYAIKLNRYIADVLTLKPVFVDPEDEEAQAELGDDPLKVHAIWEGGGFINFRIGLNVGASTSHIIRAISNQEDLGVEDKVVELEIKHNSNGDPAKWGQDEFISIDLEKYRIPGRTSVDFIIKVKEYPDGKVKSYKITYKYKIIDDRPRENQ